MFCQMENKLTATKRKIWYLFATKFCLIPVIIHLPSFQLENYVFMPSSRENLFYLHAKNILSQEADFHELIR